MRLKVWVETNKVGSRVERVIDIEDDEDYTEEDFAIIAAEQKDEMMSWDFEVL